MPTAEGTEGSGAETGSGGAASSGGAIFDTTAVEADAAGSGGCHRSEKRENERDYVWRENPAGESSGVGEGEGGPKASGVAENPRGGCHGVGMGVDFLRGTDTPGVEELTWGYKTSGVNL